MACLIQTLCLNDVNIWGGREKEVDLHNNLLVNKWENLAVKCSNENIPCKWCN